MKKVIAIFLCVCLFGWLGNNFVLADTTCTRNCSPYQVAKGPSTGGTRTTGQTWTSSGANSGAMGGFVAQTGSKVNGQHTWITANVSGYYWHGGSLWAIGKVGGGGSSSGGGGGDDGNDYVPGCSPTAPGKPALVAPANKTKLSDNFSEASASSIMIAWKPVTSWGNDCGANTYKKYRVFMRPKNDNFVESNVLKVIDATSSAITYTHLIDKMLSKNTTYYLKVQAVNASVPNNSTIVSVTSAASISGVLIDKSAGDTCAKAATALKVPGTVTFTGPRTYAVTAKEDGKYNVGVLSPGVYTPSFSGIEYVGTPENCSGGTTVSLTADGTPKVVNFAFVRKFGSWWQAVGGDVYGKYVESVIPAGLAADKKRLILPDANGQEGLLSYGDSRYFGVASGPKVSNSGWEVKSEYQGKELGYDFYKNKLSMIAQTEWVGSGKPVFAPESDADYQVYKHVGDVRLDDGSNKFVVNNNEKMVMMVDGSVTIGKDVDVDNGGFLAVIASGDVIFEPQVATVSGWYVGNTIQVKSNNSGKEDDISFTGSGSFVGWDSISLSRDRGALNNTLPSIKFYFRPDLKVNAPEVLKYANFKWSETAP